MYFGGPVLIVGVEFAGNICRWSSFFLDQKKKSKYTFFR